MKQGSSSACVTSQKGTFPTLTKTNKWMSTFQVVHGWFRHAENINPLTSLTSNHCKVVHGWFRHAEDINPLTSLTSNHCKVVHGWFRHAENINPLT